LAVGVHVAQVLVDGVIGEREAPVSPNDPKLDPDQMAEAYWQLAHQNPAAWTLELDLRPKDENFSSEARARWALEAA